MKSIAADPDIERLVERLLRYQQLEIAAMEREDVSAGNRHFDKLHSALTQLAKTSSGRDALEHLLDHDTPEVRLRAAGQIMAWAPNKAIPVLGHLIAEWRPKDRNKGYVAVRTEAKGWLYDHFGIKDFDQNKLIEPLKAYGIELRRRPDEIWL
jgi:hypothetical protein